MRNSEVEQFYQKACTSRGRLPDEDQGDKWVEVLGGFAHSQLDAAIRRWDADTTLESWERGESYPRGRRLPTPVELKLSIERFEAAEQGARLGRFMSCGQCENGWVRIGELTSQNIDTRRVQRCACWWQYVQRAKGAA